MWESRSLRFPRAVGAEGNLLLVFLCVHGPSFPPPSSCAPFLPESAKQHLLGLLHPAGSFRVALRARLPFQFGSASCLAVGSAPGPASDVESPMAWRTSGKSSSVFLCVGHQLRHAARAVEVQVRVEVPFIKRFDRFGVPRLNMLVPHVFSDHRSVLGFHQAIVVGVPRPRFRLLRQQFVQAASPPCD